MPDKPSNLEKGYGQIQFQDRAYWDTFALFNFADHRKDDLGGDSEVCCLTLATISSAVETALQLVPTGTPLMREVRNYPGFADFMASRIDGWNLEVIWQDRRFTVALFGALGSVKTFLDSYSRFMAKAINPTPSANSIQFNTVGSVIGGRLLNWLEGSTPAAWSNRAQLVELINAHKARWIDEAVGMRHGALHSGRIKGYEEMKLVITKPIPQISVN